jgi:hypothetical protein
MQQLFLTKLRVELNKARLLLLQMPAKVLLPQQLLEQTWVQRRGRGKLFRVSC